MTVAADRGAPAEHTLVGRLLTPGGRLRPGRLRFTDRLLAIDMADDTDDADATLPIIAPGFIDQHVHGGGGGDTMDGAEGVRALARHHLRHGTTALLATSLTAPWEAVLQALRGVAAVRQTAVPGEAAVLGAHLEGPFVSPERLGAQPPFAVPADAALVREVLALGVVRLATVAPEVPGVMASLPAWIEAGVRLNVGHTRADAATVEAFLAAVRERGGYAGATHLFNAMGGLEGRRPGPVGALLGDADAAIEMICDGHHVAPAAVRTAWRAARERLVLITDAIRASGTTSGTTDLGGQRVRVVDGAARLDDGTLAGSVLTMDAAVRGAVAAGVPVAAALYAASGAPAAYLGLHDRGRLQRGARADLVVLGAGLRLEAVYLAGRPLASRG
jgi:N-acetylglucosamine-6-phosphate deacetylase